MKYLGAAMVVTFCILNVFSPRPATAQLTDPPPVGGSKTGGASIHASPNIPTWLTPWRSWGITERETERYQAAPRQLPVRPQYAASFARAR